MRDAVSVLKDREVVQGYFRTVMPVLIAALLTGSAWPLHAAPENVLLDRIMGRDAAASGYGSRLAAVEELPEYLNTESIRTLIAWLTEPADALPPQAAAAIRNETFNRLLLARAEPSELAAALMTAYKDPRQNEIWRDYCLQHLSTLLSRLDESGAGRARDILWRGVDDRAGALAGTALIALQRNIGNGITREQVADSAASIAADTTRGGGARATAIQVLSELNDIRAVPHSRAVLRQSVDIVHRLAAIAALGKLGEPGDRRLVESYTTSSHPLLRNAAERAARQMDQRFGGKEE